MSVPEQRGERVLADSATDLPKRQPATLHPDILPPTPICGKQTLSWGHARQTMQWSWGNTSESLSRESVRARFDSAAQIPWQ
eukprot:2273447-Rhodomonas_salina.1